MSQVRVVIYIDNEQGSMMTVEEQVEYVVGSAADASNRAATAAIAKIRRALG